MQCELPSWDEVYDLARELAARVREEGFDPDVIVAVGRGGYTPGRILADFLHKKDLASFRVQHYRGGGVREEGARVVGGLDRDLTDLRVLVVDDVNDSGDTLKAAVGFLAEREVAEVRTAVLQQKATSTFDADFVARFVEEWRWIVYPWAVIEDLTEFVLGMDPVPRTAQEAAPRLAESYGIQVPERTLADVFGFLPQGRRP